MIWMGSERASCDASGVGDAAAWWSGQKVDEGYIETVCDFYKAIRNFVL
jgi:hypothetical protein